MKRRSFIKKSAAASAAFTIVPSFVLGGSHVPPSDTLYIGAVGVGGRGEGVLNGLFETGKVKFVAFCDVDDVRAANTYTKYPDVKRYKDFRKLYDTHIKDIDAIMVATPDHNHATVAIPFMKAGKHAYVEKPLTHNIYEARMMAAVAAEMGIVTQMGNQGSSGDGIRLAQEWIDAGVIGKVHRVDCWTNRPVWPQGFKHITEEETIPDTLNWDIWLGPAAMRPYNHNYLPFKWRGFWDFGTGAMGDMGCHIMETPFKTLGLGFPYEAEASCTTIWSNDFVEADYAEACPPSSVVRLMFDTQKHGRVSLNWYDGGIMPDLPPELGDGESPGGSGGGSIFHGTDGILVTDTYSLNPRLLPASRMADFVPPTPTLKRVTTSHQGNWVEAILNGGETSSPFSYGGPLTEAVLMGNLAIKAYQYKALKEGKQMGDWDPYDYPGRRTILWDGQNMKVTNWEEANQWVKRDYRAGWEL
ncbi:MAG TPA: Gfo/Idh/MocA family oxidoreductase [Flavobacteriaceae bacterium]|nr:Gfo/Idh/MocA family oxidoreductase [Flavobacteriaceae bacterium]MCB9214137.1 Gfo/Idh/MocA family oxidoreductase [Alteromonas sp.]HPF11960.1 Gfo/Idh/MocA family oxidoreductase [Flavobacteriaceae bacterium]HQU22063.1 Gfo/Idh/MocA family oxidoreductase [Flavobacteriaceae bacterium]HQU65408.1 Gfo/Idh/MocA family oxidoreductase [Flavobacteriaceae bacterium]